MMWKAPSAFVWQPLDARRHVVVEGPWFEAGRKTRRIASLFRVGLGPGVVGGRHVVCSARHFEYRERERAELGRVNGRKGNATCRKCP